MDRQETKRSNRFILLLFSMLMVTSTQASPTDFQALLTRKNLPYALTGAASLVGIPLSILAWQQLSSGELTGKGRKPDPFPKSRKATGSDIYSRATAQESAIFHELIDPVHPAYRNKPEGTATFYFIGGMPGAGKSTTINNKNIRIPDATKAVHIDPDHIKTRLPGWDPKNPGVVHAESRRLTDRTMEAGMSEGMDMVVQGTGKRTEHLRQVKDQGYQTVGHFVWVPEKVAQERVIQRGESGGSTLSPKIPVIVAHELRNGIVKDQIENDLYDEFYLWDNQGDKTKLVASYTKNGKYQIMNQDAFRDFFGTTGQAVEAFWKQCTR